jgi:endonuclease/exonuclease/phosphatase family metal-dependent hydrolase
MTTFSVLSFNVFSGPFSDNLQNHRRFIKQVRYILRTKPDVVCLQEFNTDDIEAIYRLLTKHGYSFYTGHRRTPRAAWTGFMPESFRRFYAGKQYLGLSTWWRTSVFSLVGASNHAFEYRGWDPLNFFRERGFQSTRLLHVASNTTLRVVNTHMNLGVDTDRYVQVQQVLGAINSDPWPIVLAGDFNTYTKRDRSYKLMASRLCVVPLGPTMIMSNPLIDFFGRVVNHDKYADFVFFRRLRLLQKSLVDIYSDHQGIFAKFDLRQSSSMSVSS